MFVAFAVNFLSALWFATRIWRAEYARKIAFVGILTIFASLIGVKWSQWWGLAISASFSLQVFALMSWTKWLENKKCQQEVLELVDRLLLEMRSGKAFRGALAEIVTDSAGEILLPYIISWMKARLAGHRSQNGPNWWREIEIELYLLDTQAHQALVRLGNWRSRLVLRADFRRRFGQVTSQIQAQALVIGGLYIALLIFTLGKGQWRAFPGLVALSLALFTGGMLLTFAIGRRIKWNF